MCWLGFSFRYWLKKTEGGRPKVMEWTFVRPELLIGGSDPYATHNRIEVGKDRGQMVVVTIRVRSIDRTGFAHGRDAEESLAVVRRPRPAMPPVEELLDENDFPLGLGGFLDSKPCTEGVERCKRIVFMLDMLVN